MPEDGKVLIFLLSTLWLGFKLIIVAYIFRQPPAHTNTIRLAVESASQEVLGLSSPKLGDAPFQIGLSSRWLRTSEKSCVA